MTARNILAFFQQRMIDAASAFDALLVFSALFAILHLAAACLMNVCGLRGEKRGWTVALLAAAALAIQISSAGSGMVFLLMDALSQVQTIFGPYGNLPMTLSAIWLIGVAVHCGCVVIGYWGLRRELRRHPDYPDTDVVGKACAAAAVSGPVAVKARNRGREIGSWGIRRPCILVPADFAEQFSPEERYWIYLHELTHWKRRDSLRFLLLLLWRACFWFDPVWPQCGAEHPPRI